jgi:hypothetical protein
LKRTHAFRYQLPTGQTYFWHVRFETDDERGKTYRYLDHSGNWKKPPAADSVLYHAPELRREKRSGADLFSTEGERDADALWELGCVATSHHQAAGHFSEMQAASLAGWKGRIFLVADRDVPGAVDVVKRYDLLRRAGIPEKQLTIIRARKGKDARDHIEAGYGPEEFVELPYRLVKEVAGTAVAEDFKRHGYLNWQPIYA